MFHSECAFSIVPMCADEDRGGRYLGMEDRALSGKLSAPLMLASVYVTDEREDLSVSLMYSEGIHRYGGDLSHSLCSH